VKALNLFLKDIYNDKKIVSDKVIPADFIYVATGYLAQCEGIVPPKSVFSHISGIDLVLGKDGVWYIRACLRGPDTGRGDRALYRRGAGNAEKPGGRDHLLPI